MALKRKPDEILAVFDQAQDVLDHPQDHDGIEAGSFNLRDLLWEVLHDVLDSIALAETDPNHARPKLPDGTYADFWKSPPSVYQTVEDYLGNNYGDD